MFARRCFCVRNRSQQIAIVRNRLRATVVGAKWPCLWRVLQKWLLLEVSRVVQTRFAWQAWHFDALCDIPTCFITCRKSLCVAGAILLRRFQKMSCSFRGRCSTWAALWRPPSSFCVAGAAHQAKRRVACFLRIPLSGLRRVK